MSVTSLLSWLTPWARPPGRSVPSSSAARSRPGVTSMILAFPWVPVVMTPACEPVKDRAFSPRDSMAIATSALEMRPPAVSSMSISRGGEGHTARARSSSSSVVSPIAETTTTTSLPWRFVSTMRSATRRIRSASATEDPPYFCTTSATVCPFQAGVAHKDKRCPGVHFTPGPGVTSRTMTNRALLTRVPIHPPIADRWSPRAFDPGATLDAEQVIDLLEAARWAATWSGASRFGSSSVCAATAHSRSYPPCSSRQRLREVRRCADPGLRRRGRG